MKEGLDTDDEFAGTPESFNEAHVIDCHAGEEELRGICVADLYIYEYLLEVIHLVKSRWSQGRLADHLFLMCDFLQTMRQIRARKSTEGN